MSFVGDRTEEAEGGMPPLVIVPAINEGGERALGLDARGPARGTHDRALVAAWANAAAHSA